MPAPFTTTDLSAMSDADLAGVLQDDPVVALLGSGVSIWHPSGLPSGKQFTLGVYEALFESQGTDLAPGPSDQAWLRAWFEGGDPLIGLDGMPFEVLMERCPRPDPLRDLVCRLYTAGGSNPVHGAIAQLASCKRIDSIITTNYDCGIDDALSASAAPLASVVREAQTSHDQVRWYFKIHGSASPGLEDTLVHRLRLEGKLAVWKSRLLHRIVQNRVVLIVGYSGLDFDICPELALAGPRAIVWNFFSAKDAEKSPGLRRLKDAGVAVTVVFGDMRELLGRLGVPTAARLARPAFDVAAELRRVFSAAELLLWRVRVLNSMGFARLATLAAEALDGAALAPAEAAQARGQSHFHAGHYRLACDCFIQASAAAADERTRRLCLLDACDAARCAGNMRLAESLVASAAAALPADSSWATEIQGVADLKRVLIWRQVSGLAGRLLWPGTRRAPMGEVRSALRRVATSAIAEGRWFDFQQAALWATRLAVPLDDLKPTDGYAPAPPGPGYRHLGYPVAVAMEACDRARRGEASLDELGRLLQRMEMFGCAPQTWKVAHAIVRSAPWLLPSHMGLFVRRFFECEYTLPMRLAWLVRGS